VCDRAVNKKTDDSLRLAYEKNRRGTPIIRTIGSSVGIDKRSGFSRVKIDVRRNQAFYIVAHFSREMKMKVKEIK
jgi:hypothetical protein